MSIDLSRHFTVYNFVALHINCALTLFTDGYLEASDANCAGVVEARMSDLPPHKVSTVQSRVWCTRFKQCLQYQWNLSTLDILKRGCFLDKAKRRHYAGYPKVTRKQPQHRHIDRDSQI